jgi:hypothetical protein
MSQQELLKKIADVHRDLGIDYMVSGSLVSSLQGEPRSTQTIGSGVSENLGADARCLIHARADRRAGREIITPVRPKAVRAFHIDLINRSYDL